MHGALDSLHARLVLILYEKSFKLKTISQGDFGHFRENIVIILSQVAKIALKIVFKLKLFPYKIIPSLVRVRVQTLGGLLTVAVPLQSAPH